MGYYSKRFWDDESGVTPPAILSDGNTSGWWDFTDASKVTLNGIYASSVLDISGNNKTMSNSDTGKQPIWNANGVLFDGTDDFLLANLANIPQPFSVYIVLKQISYSKTCLFVCGSSPSHYELVKVKPLENIRNYSGTYLIGNPLLSGNKSIINTVSAGANSLIGINNAEVVGNAGTFFSGFYGLYLGRYHASELYNSNIEVSELIIRKIGDVPQSRSDIYNYLKSKYGL